MLMLVTVVGLMMLGNV